MVNQLWPQVVQHVDDSATGSVLGAAFSKGRHQLEGQHGLDTLEIPISSVARTSSFASFVKLIASDIQRFQKIYNSVLVEYRNVHKIRSRSHPVPELECNDGWFESPFWIWNAEHPIRSSLYFQTSEKTITASDLRSFKTEVPVADFEQCWTELADQGIAIRPKALMTTMFARLALSDLFIHGIGGSKYDQLTNAIIEKYFGIQPPHFITLTASMKLTTDWEAVNRDAVNEKKHRLRELTFQPERFIDPANVAATDAIELKKKWISDSSEDRLHRHKQIDMANDRLQPFVQSQREVVLSDLQQIKSQMRTSQVLGSREYSFCLHSQELVEGLKAMIDS